MTKRDRIRALRNTLADAAITIADQAKALQFAHGQTRQYRECARLADLVTDKAIAERDQAFADAAADARNFARAAKEGQHGRYPWEEWYNRQTARLVVVEGERDEAQSEAERLTAALVKSQEEATREAALADHQANGCHKLGAECDRLRTELAATTKQRDDALEEIKEEKYQRADQKQEWEASGMALRGQLDAMTTDRDNWKREATASRPNATEAQQQLTHIVGVIGRLAGKLSAAGFGRYSENTLSGDLELNVTDALAALQGCRDDLRRVLAETAPPMPAGAPETHGEDGSGETATPAHDGTVEAGTLPVGTVFSAEWRDKPLRLKMMGRWSDGFRCKDMDGGGTWFLDADERVTVVPLTPSKKRSNATAKEA